MLCQAKPTSQLVGKWVIVWQREEQKREYFSLSKLVTDILLWHGSQTHSHILIRTHSTIKMNNYINTKKVHVEKWDVLFQSVWDGYSRWEKDSFEGVFPGQWDFIPPAWRQSLEWLVKGMRGVRCDHSGLPDHRAVVQIRQESLSWTAYFTGLVYQGIAWSQKKVAGLTFSLLCHLTTCSVNGIVL